MSVNDGGTVAGSPLGRSAAGPVAQWLEPAAHNGLVAGSSPAGPTIPTIHRRPQASADFRRRPSSVADIQPNSWLDITENNEGLDARSICNGSNLVADHVGTRPGLSGPRDQAGHLWRRGSASDVLARTIGKRLSEKMGHPVIVDSKPGADGMIAGSDVAKSPPDGYTLFFASNSPIAAAPALRKSVPYDPVRDFTPITMVGYYTFFFYAHSDVPAKTLGELIAYAKAHPGKLSYGSGNTTGSVGIAQIATMSDIKMVHIPYKGDRRRSPTCRPDASI